MPQRIGRRAYFYVPVAIIAFCLLRLDRSSAPHRLTPQLHRSLRAHRQTAAQAHAEPAGLPALPIPVTLDVDATRSVPADLDALRTALAAPAGMPGAENDAPLLDDPRGPQWIRAADRRAPVWLHVPVTAPPDTLGVYVTRSADTAAVCLRSHVDAYIQLRLRVKLPRGVYTIEKLASAAEPHAATEQATRAGDRSDQTDRSGPTPNAQHQTPNTLSRLQGRELGGRAVILKLVELPPGGLCIIRYSDAARIVQDALADARTGLHKLGAASPGPARRLRRILREAQPYIDCVTWPSRRGAASRLGCVHRLLLYLAQAQSLHHNFQNRKWVGEDAGAEVMGALERVSDALSEMSATLLDAVPQVAFVARSSGISADAGDNGSANAAEVTVTLSNHGWQTLSTVKLGVDVTGLASGAVCSPADPAFFRSLAPGQTVRATFSVRAPELSLRSQGCAADISYFLGSAPAHLRLRPW